MNVLIRAARQGDAEKLAAVGQASFLETFAGILEGADILAHCARQHAPVLYADWLSKPEVGLWLAEAMPGGAPVGYVVTDAPSLPVPPQAGDVEIKRIYLLHRFQGGGLGFRLMSTALDRARGDGKRRALLGVYGKNEPAIAFYRKIGFEQIGERKFQVGGNWYDDVVLALSL